MKFGTYQKARELLNKEEFKDLHRFNFKGICRVEKRDGLSVRRYYIRLTPRDTAIFCLNYLFYRLIAEDLYLNCYLSVIGKPCLIFY